MAVQIAAMKARKAKGIALPDDTIENKLSVLPKQIDRFFVIELGMLMLNGKSFYRVFHYIFDSGTTAFVTRLLIDL